MDNSVLLLVILDFVLIGVLPKVFFRKDGNFNLRWWATAVPVGLCPLFLTASRVFHLAPVVPASWLRVTSLAAVFCIAGSIALIALTMGTHRVPISLWHQTNDAPQHIVTWGAYRRIRHPFYTGFLLAFVGAFACFPHWATLALFLYMAAMLNFVAAREEQNLGASEFGAEYRDYVTRTGRFLPRKTSEPLVSLPSSTEREVTP